MRSPAAALTLVVVTLLVLAVWLAVRVDDGERAPVGFPPDAAGVVDEPATGPEPPPAGAAGTVTLIVEVTPRAVLSAPDPAPIPCRLVVGERDVAVGVRLLAGARSADPAARVGGRHLVAFRLPGGRELCRVVHLVADDTVAVDWQSPLRFRGVVRGPDGAPVRGASVWAGGIDAGGALELELTGDDGSFEFRALDGAAAVPLTVWATGLASRLEVVDPSRHVADPVDVQLDRAGAIDVVFAAPVSDPGLARLVLAPADDSAELRHYPFFLGGLLDGRSLRADGTGVLEDLPAGTSVLVRIDHPDAVDVRAASVRLRRPRERVVIRGRTAPRLLGRVFAPDGSPLSDVVVRAWVGEPPPIRAVGALLEPAAHAGGEAVARSDVDGRYQIVRPGPDGACHVQLSRGDCLGVRFAIEPTREDVEHDVVLPAAVELTDPLVVRVHLRSSGRVVRARRGSSAFLRWTDREPFEVRLGEPSLVDVRVVVDSGQRAVHEQWFRGLPITGPVDLRIDR